MAVLQAILAFVGRSAGKILNAIFGWAVRALFGYTTGTRRTLLTVLVAAAALWPVLLVGVALPRVATFALTFVPLSESTSDAGLRMAWIGLAALIPLLVGIAVATQSAASEVAREPVPKRLLRGYPITLGLAGAFWISFLAVPLMHLARLARREVDAYIPLVTTGESYGPVSRRLKDVLDRHEFGLQEAEPGFWTRAPAAILLALGGKALRSYVPERLTYLRGPELVVAVHPTGVSIRGAAHAAALAHGLAVEGLVACDAFQTTDPDAQRLEREIRRIWHLVDRNPSGRDPSRFRARCNAIAQELTEQKIPYDDWQIVYRQILQLDRALRDEPQLLTGERPSEGEAMEARGTVYRGPEAERPTTELLRETASKAGMLARKELELARAEIHADFRSELAMLKGFAAAAVLGIAALNALVVAAILALSSSLEGWQAGLLVAGTLLAGTAVAAAIGWKRRVVRPLERTRRTIDDNVKWAQERLA